jgi:hypothetical protein
VGAGRGAQRPPKARREDAMELYEIELQEAHKRLGQLGRKPDDFAFSMSYLPPDPDGGGMFTVRYEIDIVDQKTSKSLACLGGIGLDWVAYFEAALKQGHFD